MTFMKLLYLMRLVKLLKPLHDAVNTFNVTQSVCFHLYVSVGHTTLIPNDVKHLNEGYKVLDATSGKLVFASKG